MIKAGETLFVSAASGAVGSVGCQVAKLKGVTVIGSVGGPQKGAFLREIRVDHVIDYKQINDLAATLGQAAPDGIDAYFDNVGGAHLEAALDVAKPFARFALCGTISGYNGEGKGPGNLSQTVGKRLLLQGFIVSDHFDLMPAFVRRDERLDQSGQRQVASDSGRGPSNKHPALFSAVFRRKFRKMLVKLG